MSNKTSASVSGQKVTPSPAVLESVQKVQREMEIKNTRNEVEERQWALCKTAAEQAVSQIMLRQGMLAQQTQREDGIPFDFSLPSTNQNQISSHFQAQSGVPSISGLVPTGLNVQDHSQMSGLFSINHGNTNPTTINDIVPDRNLHEERGIACSTILALLELIIIFLFGIFVSYDNEVTARPTFKNSSFLRQQHEEDSSGLHHFYPLFQDVHVMIFIGFGFLMTFLRKYGYSAVGYNMLIGAIAIQWSILCRGIFHHGLNTIPIDITNIINGDFAAAAVLITFGAILGCSDPLQLVTLCLIEVFLYALNEWIGAELLQAIDIGGSMWIHTFGAYFGLALSLTLRRQTDITTTNEEASYTSDIFSMVGTVFLWLYWPSFNGAMALGDDQHRAVINTVLSLTGSCIFSFAVSAILSKENKFSMVHIQNASLAGGVAVGAVADLMIKPFGALLIGSLAGFLSVVGYVYITPFLQRTLGLHDTCGVHNLHGMPGVLSGLIGVLMAGLATEKEYGKSLYLQYAARSPNLEDTYFTEVKLDLINVEPGSGRSAEQQALYQLAALGITLGIALVGGAVTGLILRIPIFGKVPNETLFDDNHYWEVPSEETKNLIQRTNSYVEGTNPNLELSQQRRSQEKEQAF